MSGGAFPPEPDLPTVIRDEIRARGAISFARFMELALHHPTAGYYARGAERLGRRGDFITASDVGPAFGACMARQIVEIDRSLDHPSPFRYVEHGAGRGLLAKDVADALALSAPELRRRLRIDLVDTSAGMRDAAAALLPEARTHADPAGVEAGAGCAIAVELFDALPVHRVRRRGTTLVEVRVALDGERLIEVEGPPDRATLDAARQWGAAPHEGDEAEVCLALPSALAGIARSIDRGAVLIVDYGYDAAALYGPAHRRGTLMAYHRHRAHEDYLARPGEQDMTAHVNFTALTSCARDAGLAPAGFTTQDRFLVANGILADLDGSADDLAATQRRLQAKQLIHPDGMGRRFKVAVFAKGMEPAPRWKGLEDPFA